MSHRGEEGVDWSLREAQTTTDSNNQKARVKVKRGGEDERILRKE